MVKEKQQHILIIGFVWPEPRSSAAGSRMMQLISLFQSQDWEITFASPAARSEHMVDFESLGIDTVSIEINSSEFDSFIKELQPSVVMFDRFVTEEQFGWRVAEHCPQAIRMLDTEDLHCLRRARKKAVGEERDFLENELLSMPDAKREIASIYRSDLSLMISEAEIEVLCNIFGVEDKLLQYVPFLLDPIDEATRQQWPDFESRDHFVTIGNFQHKPNADAIRYLKRDIWPRIRKELPQAELHIYGAYPTQNIEQLDKREEGFLIKGRAENAQQVMRRAKVCLAPLRFGAGLKGKLVEAMQCGTPSVTTDIGAEGLNGKLPWGGTIANKPARIAKAAQELFSNKRKWENAQAKGTRIINQRFAAQEHGTKLIDRITHIQEDLQGHRQQNFTGSMLMHHTMASTRYMSRWIEAKNS